MGVKPDETTLGSTDRKTHEGHVMLQTVRAKKYMEIYEYEKYW